MNEFTIVTLIDRPVDQVFSVVQDVEKEPVWTPGLTEARQTSPGPMETGATVVYAGSFLGRKYETHLGAAGGARRGPSGSAARQRF